ncbi:MAG: FGGY-family carbohydrate kinase [Marinilabiliaceae bacterium]
MKQKVIAVFDIGKTNKKFLLFDEALNVVFQQEEKFDAILDDDGDECDDIEKIEAWIHQSLKEKTSDDRYEVMGMNFSTYGASLAFLDKNQHRLTPLYDYLKNIPQHISENLYEQYGGKDEFCRKTASPALGHMLNSGMQILWLKEQKPAVYEKITDVLHFPQYLSHLFTKRVLSEHTSVGCHTAMWDFDNMQYHRWLSDHNIMLPNPSPNDTVIECNVNGEKLKVGTGIHDSSSSLVPYMVSATEKFILISTGTWCINMNPYNYEPLTSEELEQDCLCYLSIDEKPVKSSRLFMGHIHDANVARLTKFFSVSEDAYKKVNAELSVLRKFFAKDNYVFFENGLADDYVDRVVDLAQFNDFSEAYHRLMFDLTRLNVEKIKLVLTREDDVKRLYVSGGFARNEIYVKLLAGFFPDKEVYTTQVENSSALGAALSIWDVMEKDVPDVGLDLKKWSFRV